MKLILSKYTNIPIAGAAVITTQHKTKSQRQLQRCALMGKLYEIFAGFRNARNAKRRQQYKICKNNYKRTETDQISGNFYFWGHSWNGYSVFVAAAWVKINYIDKIRAIKSKRRQ